MDWDKLAKKEVKPPYRPKNVSPTLSHPVIVLYRSHRTNTHRAFTSNYMSRSSTDLTSSIHFPLTLLSFLRPYSR